MDKFLVLGIVVLTYGLSCILIGLFKTPKAVWNMGKIEGFKKILGDVGTQVFLTVWGAAALGLGAWLAFFR